MKKVELLLTPKTCWTKSSFHGSIQLPMEQAWLCMFCLLFSPLLLGPPSPLHARLAFGFCLHFMTIGSQFFFFVKFSQKSLSHPYTLSAHSFLIYLLFVILILFWVLILYFNISVTFQFYFLIMRSFYFAFLSYSSLPSLPLPFTTLNFLSSFFQVLESS